MKLIVFKHYRAARLHWEYYSHNDVRFLSFGWASPKHHRWWARTFYLYF